MWPPCSVITMMKHRKTFEGCTGKNAVREEKAAEGWVLTCMWVVFIAKKISHPLCPIPTHVSALDSCPLYLERPSLPHNKQWTPSNLKEMYLRPAPCRVAANSCNTLDNILQFKLSFSTTIHSLAFLWQRIEKSKHVFWSDVQDLQCHKTGTGSDHRFFWFETLSRRHSTSCCTGRYKKPLQMQLSNHLPAKKLSLWHPWVRD